VKVLVVVVVVRMMSRRSRTVEVVVVGKTNIFLFRLLCL